jgi:hypothetical protein
VQGPEFKPQYYQTKQTQETNKQNPWGSDNILNNILLCMLKEHG